MTDPDYEAVASREDRREADKSSAENIRLWLDAISIAQKEEEEWRERAEYAVNVYRSGSDRGKKRDRTFNVLHSNVETIVPAIYNSPPIPDVRRRFSDRDPVGKEVCDLLERALSYSIDSYDFDCHLRAAAKDGEITGRGVSRVRYVPYVEGDEVAYEEVTCEHVQWKNFLRGPGQTWADIPWVAFELFLTREQLVELSPKEGAKVELDCEVKDYTDKHDGRNVPEVFKRARVWEIWDKQRREVLFIAESKKDGPLVTEKDPLGLTGFFPVPRPLYAIDTTDTLVPVVPYDIYRDQAEELERVSQRIMGLVEALKARGIYDGRMVEIARVAEADDGELVAVENTAVYADSGLEKGISWWPIEAIAAVLERLYLQRDQIKSSIYEITGISDILRGESDSKETATAQNIKNQWGSLRIQRKQAEIQRYARDLFRMKSEIIASKFSWQTISMMTGLQYPTQQEKQMLQQQVAMGQEPPKDVQEILKDPAREEVEAMLRNDALRGFRIDVESDSTIRADMTRNQNMMSTFLEGTASYVSAMGPIVQSGLMPPDAVIEVYSAFARNFRLGKQAEDALDRLADNARKAAEGPKKPTPEEAQMQAEQTKMQADVQMKQAEMQAGQAKMQADVQLKQAEMQADMQSKQQDAQMKREEMQLKMQLEREKAELDLQVKREELALKREEMKLKQQEMLMKAQFEKAKHDVELQRMDHEYEAAEIDAAFRQREFAAAEKDREMTRKGRSNER